ncbi:MAG: hypothetical protein ACE5EH_12465 [Gammaproteobacteria bacterium]
MKHATAIALCLSFLSLSESSAQSQNTKLVLQTSDTVSRTGHFQLSWQYDGPTGIFELQQSNSDDFKNSRTIYKGPDKARTMSGLTNGNYYYRLRSSGHEWSEAIVVKVEHYELSTAFIFLGLGAIVFLATAILIVRGHIKHRNEGQVLNG